MASTLRQVIAPGTDTGDSLLAALVDAVAVLQRVRDRADELIGKTQALIAERQAGRPWEEILRDEPAPRLSVLLADSADAVAGASSRVRRAQVEVLYRRGVAMHRIGSLLGITRQRVAVLLKATQQEEGEVGGTPR